MAKSNISQWDVVAGNNLDLGGISVAEGWLPSTVNNFSREEISQLAKFYDDFGGVNTVGGTGDAVTITTSTVYTALATGIRFGFKPTAANTGAATLNFDAIGAKAIRKISGGTDVALGARDLVISRRAELIYDSTANSAAGAWILLNPTLEGPYPTGSLFGLTLSNGTDATNDIDIAPGTARDSTDVENMVLTSVLTKQLDAAWAVGTNAGGLDTGAIANATYHIHLIKRLDTGVVDALYSLSATSPTMPANYTLKRRIGSIIRAAGSIIAFWQHGDTFTISPITERSNTAAAASALLAIVAPAGIVVEMMMSALVTMSGSAAVDCAVRVGSADHGSADVLVARIITTVADGSDATYGTVSSGTFTNTSGQIYFSQTNTTGTPTASQLFNNGWIDRRGRV